MRNILFVDDDPNILAGLRRILRSQRGEWNTEFLDDPRQALQTMDQHPFDVIVTDMRMPGMDGEALLDAVKKRHPATVRIMLSGESEREQIVRVIGPVHQYLSKPCEPDILKTAIARSCALRDTLADDTLKRLISRVDSIPSFPKPYEDLISELNAPESSMDQVAETISRDVGMSTRILQLVNSSFFGLPCRVEDPAHAARVLGLNLIKSLVLSAGVFSQIKEPTIAKLSLDSLLSHSLQVGTNAQAIARSVSADKHLAQDSLQAGIIHDVGKLLLAAELPELYAEAIELHEREHIEMWEAEVEIFGASHAEVGGYLLGLWGLPNALVEAVTYHHRPSDCQCDVFCPLTAVHVANSMERLDTCGDESESPFDVDYLDRLDINHRLTEWRELLETSNCEAMG